MCYFQAIFPGLPAFETRRCPRAINGYNDPCLQNGWGSSQLDSDVMSDLSLECKGNPPNATPPGNKDLIRPNEGTMVVYNTLIRPY